MVAPNSWKLIHSGARLTIKVPMPCLLFIDEMSRKALIKTLKSRSEVAAATLELIKKEWRRNQASLVYLRNDAAKDYKMKVLEDFLRQERISHEVTERYCPQSHGLAKRLNLAIMDNVHCMLIDANLPPKLWPYAAYYAVLMYNNLPHYALDNHKSQMTLMETHLIFRSSTSSVVFVLLFNSQSFYTSWRKDQQKDFFLELILLATKFWNYKAKLPM
jgi:hypothetical protein